MGNEKLKFLNFFVEECLMRNTYIKDIFKSKSFQKWECFGKIKYNPLKIFTNSWLIVSNSYLIYFRKYFYEKLLDEIFLKDFATMYYY